MNGTFWWWDDAIEVAYRRAQLTGRRFRVSMACPGWWTVQEVGA